MSAGSHLYDLSHHPAVLCRHQRMSCSGKCHCKSREDKKMPDRPLSEDEIWGSDDESISPHADLRRAHVNQGYLDGITKAQELGLQDGFDKGFPSGASLGLRVGKVLAKLHGKPQFKEAQETLNITQVLDKKYFDNQLDLQNSQHMLLAQWEKTVGLESP